MRKCKKISKFIPVLFTLLLLFLLPWTVRANDSDDINNILQGMQEDLNKVLNISGPGEYTADFPKETYRGTQCTLTITNTSKKPLKLIVDESINRTSVSTDSEIFSRFNEKYTSPRDVTITYYFAPEQTVSFQLSFASDYGGGVSKTSYFKITAQKTSIKDNGGKTFSSAQKIKSTGSVSGFVYDYESNPTKNVRYFTFSLSKKRILKVKYTCDQPNGELFLFKSNDRSETNKLASLNSRYTTSSKTIILKPGKYVLKTLVHYNYKPGIPGVYSIKLEGRDYIPATGVKLVCTDKSRTATKAQNKVFHFKATTVPSNSDDKLKNITLNGEVILSDSLGKNSKSFKVSRLEMGYNNVQATASNGKKSKKVKVAIVPQKPSLGNKVTTYYDKVVFDVVNNHYQGSGIRLYLHNGKKWVRKQTGTGLSTVFFAKNLKSNRKYKFKFVSIAKGANGKIVESNPLIKTYRTAPNVSPSVDSIAASNVEVTSSYQWVKGDYGDYVFKEVFKTSYTLTIDLNNPIPGSKGIEINSGGRTCKVSGTGTHFVASFTVDGNCRGETTSVSLVSYSMNSSLGGYGPSVRHDVTIN